MRFSKWHAVASLTAAAAVASLTLAMAGPATAQPAGYGWIGNYHSGKCLSNSPVQDYQYLCGDYPNEYFTVYSERSVDGVTLYNLEDDEYGQCLDLEGGSTANGAHVISYTCNSSDDAQEWYLVNTDIAGWYNFVNWASQTCMTVSADSQGSGALVQGWSCATAQSDHSYFWEPHTFP
jgi:hypothetical protein